MEARMEELQQQHCLLVRVHSDVSIVLPFHLAGNMAPNDCTMLFLSVTGIMAHLPGKTDVPRSTHAGRESDPCAAGRV